MYGCCLGGKILLVNPLTRTLAYLVCTTLVVAVAVAIKFLYLMLGDAIVYEIPLIGDVLRSLEIMELFNILVFAILGMGFGIATKLLPWYFGSKVSKITLAILIPIIFLITAVFRYEVWVQKFELQENIGSRNQAISFTNSFLREKTNGQSGIVGFYLYTAKLPILPSTTQDIEALDDWMRTSQDRFARVTRLEGKIVTNLFFLRGWVLRIFYFLISIFTTIANFKEGRKTFSPIL